MSQLDSEPARKSRFLCCLLLPLLSLRFSVPEDCRERLQISEKGGEGGEKRERERKE